MLAWAPTRLKSFPFRNLRQSSYLSRRSSSFLFCTAESGTPPRGAETTASGQLLRTRPLLATVSGFEPGCMIRRMSATRFTRRRLIKAALAAAPAVAFAPGLLGHAPSDIHIAPGPFQPTWESLKAGYKTPDWFCDAKFGIWNHWTAQCVPEQGDWYARRMYLQGDKDYDHHLKTYGHPSKVGWMRSEEHTSE